MKALHTLIATLHLASGETRDVASDVLATGCEFVEAPRIDDDGTIHFSDLLSGDFYRRRPDEDAARKMLTGRRWIGGSALCADGAILVSGEDGIMRLDPESGALTPVLTELNGRPIGSVNDLEADDAGGLYGGTVDFPALLERGEEGIPGVLFRLDPDGSVEILREGIAVSNGMAFTPDRRRFYHADCGAGLWVYDVEGGRPCNPRLMAQYSDCDGLAVDAEGAVWVARWSASEILRYLPDGSLDRRITLPVPHIISVAFGGPDLTCLYAATGGRDADGNAVGGIVRIPVGIEGQRDARARV